MSPDRLHRRLAAIMAADVVGYSRLMEQDETGTLAVLRERQREILAPLIARHDGRVVKLMGDGVLAEFASAVNAVACAIELQDRMARANADSPAAGPIVLRIGVNLGDIVVEGDDIYGDGVNVAARLETLAEPGGICISGSVHEQVRRKLDAAFIELGAQKLKNIAEPVAVYRVSAGAQGADASRGAAPPIAEAASVPAKPSVAVLPFTIMGGDADDEIFADGLTDDLITDLSRNAGLFVIARHSVFAYKGGFADARRIAGELGVRYLLEGSARRASGRVRINAQLIDAIDGGHLWAERYDRDLDDVFAVQDEVVGRIVEALVGRLAPPPPRRRPANLEAYDLCVRARMLVAQSPAAAQEARLLLQRSIELDPDYAEAHRWLAFFLWESWLVWGEPSETHRANALRLAERAVALDPNDAGNHGVLGYLLAYKGRWDESAAEFARALELDTNHAESWVMLADVSVLRGRAAEAIAQIERAFRLNPQPPGRYYWLKGFAQYAGEDYARAAETLRHESTYRTGSRRILAAALAQLGRVDEARREAALFMAGDPGFTIRQWIDSHPFDDEPTRQRFVAGYRLAGLREESDAP